MKIAAALMTVLVFTVLIWALHRFVRRRVTAPALAT